MGRNRVEHHDKPPGGATMDMPKPSRIYRIVTGRLDQVVMWPFLNASSQEDSLMKEYAFTINTLNNTLCKFMLQNRGDSIVAFMLDDTGHELRLCLFPASFNLFIENLNKVVGAME